MASQGHDGPRAVGFDIPHANGLVVRAAHDSTLVELNATHSTRVTFESANVALSA